MKRTYLKLLVLFTIIAVSSGLLSGCAWSIGSDHGQGKIVAQPTRGQELIDLQKARDQGAMTEEEYQTQRKQIMAR